MSIYSTVTAFVVVVLMALVSPLTADTLSVDAEPISVESLVRDSVEQAHVLDSLRALAKVQKAEVDSMSALAKGVADAERAREVRDSIHSARMAEEIKSLKASTSSYVTPVIESGKTVDLKVNLSEAGRRTAKVAVDLGSKGKAWATSEKTKAQAANAAEATGRGIVASGKFLGKWGVKAFQAGKEAAFSDK